MIEMEAIDDDKNVDYYILVLLKDENVGNPVNVQLACNIKDGSLNWEFEISDFSPFLYSPF